MSVAVENTSELDKRILAYCMQSAQCLLHCADRITDDYFDSDYRSLYAAIIQYYKKYKKLVTAEVILTKLRKKQTPEERYRWYEQLITELLEAEIINDQFLFDFDEFENGYFDGLLREALEGTGPKDQGFIDLLSKEKNPKAAWQRIKKAGLYIESRVQTDYVDRGFFRDSVEARQQRYQRIKSGEKNPFGLLTGFGALDRATKGLQGGEMLIIAGRPGTGKSAVLVAIAKNLYKGIPNVQEPKNVLLFSLEMPRQQYEHRFDAAFTGLILDHIELGIFTPEEEEIYLKGLEEQKQAVNEFYIVDRPGCTPLTVEAELEIAVEKFRPDAVLIDYLGIVQSDEDKGRDDLNQGFAAEGIRRIGRERKLPMITAVQMNRPKDRKGDTGTHRVSRSDIISQTTDVLVQIDDTVIEESSTTGDFMNFVTVKNRKGSLDTFQMYCNFATMTIENMTGFDYAQLREPRTTRNSW